MIAALFVETGGCYFGVPDVDPWDEPRDAKRCCRSHGLPLTDAAARPEQPSPAARR